MQLISKKISTSCASMTVIDSKEWASWPILDLLKLWFYDVQNNGYSIFIVISYDTLMSVGGIATHDSILFTGEFGRMVRSNVPINLLLFHSHVFGLLLDSHDEASIGSQLVLTFRLLQGTLVLLLLPILIMFRLLIKILMGFTCWWLRFATALSTSWGLPIRLILLLRLLSLNITLWLVSDSGTSS